MIGVVLVLAASSILPAQAAGASTLRNSSDTAAFVRISNERNSEAKKNLALDFEKKFPESKHLPDVYIQLSRVLVSQSDFAAAKQYAKKAVGAVARLESAAPENADDAWHQWMKSVAASAKSNLAWIDQVVAWQEDQIRSNVIRRPK
jgi:hypothetical protein